MSREEFYYESSDNITKIHACIWIPDDKQPKGIIQIAHGVTEYILRYEEFAKYFTSKGYIVVGNDHIGHGLSVAEGREKMYFGKEGSWDFVVDDIKKCYEITKKRFPNLEYIFLGFSLGSFLMRTYLIKYPNDIHKAIIMGTGQISAIPLKLARSMANSEAKKVGEDHSTQKIHDLTFGTYNKIFAPNKTEYDWLCANEEALREYIDDPLRGGDFSAGLFREMLNGMLYTSKINNIQKMNKDIKILLISGQKDPVGNCGKGVIKTYKAFKKAGINNISLKLMPNDRHDILHEKDKLDVYNIIYKFCIDD